MASTNPHERSATGSTGSIGSIGSDPTERISLVLAFLLVLLGFALSSDSVERRAPTSPASIELEGAAAELPSSETLDESRARQSSRRLRLRDLERTIRIADRPFEVAIVHTPAARSVVRVAIEPRAGRDLLILHRRFLI
jgi:hypothetical protein